MRRLLAVTAAVCAAVLIAGPAGADEEEDQAIADEAVLQASDFPDDWESTPADDGEEIQLPECRAINRATATADKQPNAKSPNFADSSDALGITQAENATYVFPSKKKAKAYATLFAGDESEDCFQAAGEAVAESDAPGADVSVEKFDVEGLGDGGGGFTLVVDGVSEDDEPVELYADFSAVRVDRGVVVFIAQGNGEQLELGPDLLETLVGRLEEAL
ncbi:MAG: hypothetical protein ACR2IR_00820 [Acidimicrobiia bacterium]